MILMIVLIVVALFMFLVSPRVGATMLLVALWSPTLLVSGWLFWAGILFALAFSIWQDQET